MEEEIKKSDDFKLNDTSNFNPGIEKFKNLTQEQKERMMNDWERQPLVKNANIGAYDKDKEQPISKRILKTLQSFAIVGIVALFIIAAAMAMWGYTIYKDGTLKSPVSLVCGNVTIPSCPEAPACTNTCGECICGNLTCQTNYSIPPINVYCNNTG